MAREDSVPDGAQDRDILGGEDENVVESLAETELDLISAGVDAGRSLWIFEES